MGGVRHEGLVQLTLPLAVPQQSAEYPELLRLRPARGAEVGAELDEVAPRVCPSRAITVRQEQESDA
ncbi:hypothetical protein IM697_42675 [Streptomyces ferrugineus]|uniref:Uncharacterized protein n=1 Tax=Streptomyces ferrugineus TaxID=1413221 RepID=A0A7M2SN00_9ACTN|nr:hypothetical protein [Streptomyces ferrugineus]QOV36611.1 hypothetical protein IM697_42675 [Streptomyces ferrugineus]